MIGAALLWQSAGCFGAPLSATDAVRLALDKHLDIKIAQEKTTQAKYTLQSTEDVKGLSVDASNTFYLKQIHFHSLPSSTSLTVSLPLYSGGKNEGNIEVAKTDVKIADLDLAKTRQDVVLKTLSAYYDVLDAQKVQQVDQETVDNYRLHLQNAQAQYYAGSIAKADVLRSEVELADAQQSLVKAKNNTQVAMNNLKNLIRWKSEEGLVLTDDFQYIPWNKTLEQCLQAAKANRPDLQKYRLTVDEARQNIDIAKADKKPSVALNVASSWGSSMIPDSNNSNLYVGVSTSWNLFDGQITTAKIKKSESSLIAAQLQLEQQEDSVELAVKEYYLGISEAEKRLKTTQVAIHKADEDAFIAEEKYKAGEGLLLDIIDAQLALSTAKNNYITAQYDYVTYVAKLKNAMGID